MRNCAQIGIDDEIFVDSFAGGGGASTGMEVGLGITVAAALVNWWENNSFTPEAIEADQYLTRLKQK